MSPLKQRSKLPYQIKNTLKLLTAYYSNAVENHDRYHMGVAIWEAPKDK